MNKQVKGNEQNLENFIENPLKEKTNDKKGSSMENKKISDKGANEANDKDAKESNETPGNSVKTESSEETIQGIGFNQILETIPRELRSDAVNYFRDNDIIATLSEKIIPHWNENQQYEVIQDIFSGNDIRVPANILVNIFQINQHIDCAKTHKKFIEKVFYRFRSVFNYLQEETVLIHDQSKLSFVEIVGYTDKWTWHRCSQLWGLALDHHYQHNPHHPQNTPGLQMTHEALEESVVDMMACHWERQEGGEDDISAERVVGFSDFYLNRYLQADKEIVLELLRKIRESGL